jgi:hypothetical protein
LLTIVLSEGRVGFSNRGSYFYTDIENENADVIRTGSTFLDAEKVLGIVRVWAGHYDTVVDPV